MNVAFDVDDTIYRIIGEYPTWHQIPDYELIPILLWHVKNGHNVFVWSAGGIAYAKSIVYKLGLEGLVSVIEKDERYLPDMDLCYDDQEVNLARVNIRVRRPLREEA